MALINFVDSKGTAWRVWNVTRDTISAARADYLGSQFRDGWLVFQPEESDERRRLAVFPDDWAALDAEQLEALCARAVPVEARRNDRPRDATVEVPRFEKQVGKGRQ